MKNEFNSFGLNVDNIMKKTISALHMMQSFERAVRSESVIDKLELVVKATALMIKATGYVAQKSYRVANHLANNIS